MSVHHQNVATVEAGYTTMILMKALVDRANRLAQVREAQTAPVNDERLRVLRQQMNVVNADLAVVSADIESCVIDRTGEKPVVTVVGEKRRIRRDLPAELAKKRVELMAEGAAIAKQAQAILEAHDAEQQAKGEALYQEAVLIMTKLGLSFPDKVSVYAVARLAEAELEVMEAKRALAEKGRY